MGSTFTSAFDRGLATGEQQRRSAQTGDLAARSAKADELTSAMQGIQKNLGSVDPNSKEYGQYRDALADTQQQLTSLYAPHEGPHLMQRLATVFGHPAPTAPPVKPGMTVDQVLAMAAPRYQAPLLSRDEERQAALVHGGLTLSAEEKAKAEKTPTTETWTPLAGEKPFQLPGDKGWAIHERSKAGEIRTKEVPDYVPPAPKPKGRDDRYIEILAKKQGGKPLTEDEKAYATAYQIYTQQTKVAPGVARAAAMGADRYIPVMDPSDPENVTFMRAGDAARMHATSPASIGFQTDKAITKYMTSGTGATNLNYFNTATEHLKLLKQAATELRNGNIPAFNRLANAYASATGSPAPTNFNAVKNAVSGELAKTFKGTGATDTEIGEISGTINNAQSDEQIDGAIGYYTALMGGKVTALQSQYEAGKKGKPAFSTDTPPAKPNTSTPARHKIKIGSKFYTYNGSGNTADLKNYTEVPK